jgi:hypothetical protein
MSLRVTEKRRFDDNDLAPNGDCYSGFDFLMKDNRREYCIRLYDDEPGAAIVIEPFDIKDLPEARTVADFITTELACSNISFYCDSAGHYKPIDVASLEFKPEEQDGAGQPPTAPEFE